MVCFIFQDFQLRKRLSDQNALPVKRLSVPTPLSVQIARLSTPSVSGQTSTGLFRLAISTNF